MESQFARDGSQLSHVFFMATGVAGYEIGYDLLIEMFLAADTVELALEVVEQLERRFAHEAKHTVAGMFRSYFKAAADVAGNEFAGVLLCGAVGCFVFTII